MLLSSISTCTDSILLLHHARFIDNLIILGYLWSQVHSVVEVKLLLLLLLLLLLRPSTNNWQFCNVAFKSKRSAAVAVKLRGATLYIVYKCRYTKSHEQFPLMYTNACFSFIHLLLNFLLFRFDLHWPWMTLNRHSRSQRLYDWCRSAMTIKSHSRSSRHRSDY